MFKTVLLIIDHRNEVYKPFEQAMALTKTFQSHLIILSIIHAKDSPKNDEELEKSFYKNIQATVDKANIYSDVIRTKVGSALVICDVANEVNADVIVLGDQIQTLENTLESTVNDVLAISPCPVLLVP